MIRKSLLVLLLVLIIISVVFYLVTDFNKYRTASKNISYKKEGIVFSVTTFDGKNETKPFVKCLGHTWLSLDNYSGHSIYLKDYEIKNNENLSFSVWAITAHKGVYFNLEPHFIEEQNRYIGRKSISMNIDENQVHIIEDYIDKNNKWASVQNCSYWSIHLWNKIADEQHSLKTQTLVYTPEKLLKSIQEYNLVEENKDFSNAGKIFFYNKGKREELELCKRK